ncbi:hypothetical protein SAMN04487893_11567 [Myroides guanonis]|uniref:Uncharacterized protein n=1 Tax=Myroides guanonis TaxID=1150112 RepID=A0A1I3U0N8_9FLAO|nr:hypothetical protein SAMN04487893_11567 [Myroides guanonis]
MKNLNIIKEIFNLTINIAIAYTFIIITDKFIDVNSIYNLVIKTLVVLLLVAFYIYNFYKIVKKRKSVSGSD